MGLSLQFLQDFSMLISLFSADFLSILSLEMWNIKLYIIILSFIVFQEGDGDTKPAKPAKRLKAGDSLFTDIQAVEVDEDGPVYDDCNEVWKYYYY